MVALVDSLGKLARFELLPGQRHESLVAEKLLSGVETGAVLADRGFDGDALRDSIAERGAEPVIPPKSNRKKAIDCDMEKYRRRHRVENFFCRIKRFRRIATRYDQTASSYAALIFVAATMLALE